jgi:tRNA (mo5U34)-methyltransferase
MTGRPTAADEAVSDADEARRLGPWFHNLRLPDGTSTAPDHFLGDFPSFKWRELAPSIPRELTGWRCLDIGCNAGFYSFELARRGGSVLGIDCDERYLAQARWAADRFGLSRSIAFKRMQVYELAHLGERFDLVLFMGVFYHLRYPLLALDIVGRLARRLLLFQTMTMPGTEAIEHTDGLDLDHRGPLAHPGWPKMAFIEHRFQGDPTNWWAPNHAAVEAMLRSTGMRVIARPGHEAYLCEPDPANPSCVDTWDAEELLSATGSLRSC